MITKKERRAALERTNAFIAEFKALPDEAIVLNEWFLNKSDYNRYNKIYGTPDFKEVSCGSVGCVGGWLNQSKLFKAFDKTLTSKQTDQCDSLELFLGITEVQADRWSVFVGRRNYNIPEKTEALARLTKIVKHHKAALAKAA